MKGSQVSVLTLVLLAVSPFMLSAQQVASKPNLTGKWVFSAQKSSLKVPPPNSMTLEIEQSDPHIHFTRTQVYGDQKLNWELAAATNGQKDVVQEMPSYTANVHVYWDGSSLVLDQQMTASDGTKASDVVTYSLIDDGKVLQAVERQTVVGATGAMMNKWVYDRLAQ